MLAVNGLRLNTPDSDRTIGRAAALLWLEARSANDVIAWQTNEGPTRPRRYCLGTQRAAGGERAPPEHARQRHNQRRLTLIALAYGSGATRYITKKLGKPPRERRQGATVGRRNALLVANGRRTNTPVSDRIAKLL